MAQDKKKNTTGERRKTHRTDVQIWAEEKTGKSSYYHLLTNLSCSGFFIDKKIPFPVNSILNLEFDLPGSDKKIKVKGRVVKNYKDTVSNRIGMGVKFVEIKENGMEEIKIFLDKLKK